MAGVRARWPRRQDIVCGQLPGVEDPSERCGGLAFEAGEEVLEVVMRYAVEVGAQ